MPDKLQVHREFQSMVASASIDDITNTAWWVLEKAMISAVMWFNEDPNTRGHYVLSHPFNRSYFAIGVLQRAGLLMPHGYNTPELVAAAEYIRVSPKGEELYERMRKEGVHHQYPLPNPQ
jgi:hypothetical protein